MCAGKGTRGGGLSWDNFPSFLLIPSLLDVANRKCVTRAEASSPNSS